MNISNLLFFDKKGEAYNLNWNSDGYWEGADYFLPISTALFDNSNIFILEKVTEFDVTSYKFPVMEPDSKFEIVWKTADAKDTFFVFTITREGSGNDAVDFITRQESITVNHSDFGESVDDLDIAYPFQINVAFNPLQEIAYSRVMQLYYTNDSGRNLVLDMTFYGEGEDEDERFRVWLENFGIRFNREDALILKDYDLKESLADWKQINAARKQLLVNQDQVYPYVGTYKGMLNLVTLLGYKDVLRVKEYWQNTNPNSGYYKKFAMVDVTDLMQLGDITKVNLIDENGGLKNSESFRKTEFLALAYQFTVATDDYDDDGLPVIVPTTEFSVNEIFFKLHGVAKKLETEILPINVVIRDIIGEFIYFNKFNLRNWIDETTIEALQINDVYKVKVLEPNSTALQLKIRDIKTLYPKLNGISAFPSLTYNEGPIEPYQNEQAYLASETSVLINAIEDYYADIIEYDYLGGSTNPTGYGDDSADKIGCPVVLEAFIEDLTLQDLDGVTFNDFITSAPTTSSTSNDIGTGTKVFNFFSVDVFSVGSRVKLYVTTDQSQYMEGTITDIGPIGPSSTPGTSVEIDVTSASGNATGNTSWTVYLIDIHHTIATLKYRNGYEIEWLIEGPQYYRFSQRGKLSSYAKLPHILPHSGDYVVSINVYDMQGGVSIDRIELTVNIDEPAIQVFLKIQDKFKYDIRSLSNIRLGDFAQSPIFDPLVNVVNPNGFNKPVTQINSQYLDWYTYSNYWGVGGRLDTIEVFYDGEGYRPYLLSNNPAKKNWGTGTAEGQPTLDDYSSVTLGELYHADFSELSYVGDTLDGFYIDLKSITTPAPGSYLKSLQFGGFAPLDIEALVAGATAESLVNYLQTLTTVSGWSDYRYVVIGDRVKATAKSPIKRNHSIVTVLQRLTAYDSGTSTSYPADEVGLTISDTVISDSTLYTLAEYYESPTIGETSGLVAGDRVRIQNDLGGYIDGVVTNTDSAGFTIQAQSANQIGDFSQFDIFWLETVYTFSQPKNVFSQASLTAVQTTLDTIEKEIDLDLLFLYGPLTDKLKTVNTQIPAPASKIQYWIDKGYVKYDELDEDLYQNTVQIDLSLDPLLGPSNTPTNYRILDLYAEDNNWKHRTNDGEVWTLTEDLYIRINDSETGWTNGSTLRLVFDTPIDTDGYSIYIVTDALDASELGEYGVEIATLTQADFPKLDGYPSRLAVEVLCNTASSFSFSVTKSGPVQKGYLPSYYDENSFTLSNIKSTQGTLIVPTHHPVFLTISNVASNVITYWNLLDENGAIIINVVSPSYFIWRFDKPGSYTVQVESIDTRNNTTFSNSYNVAVANVADPKRYRDIIEKELNDRKRLLTQP
jgi:hypothetical protein